MLRRYSIKTRLLSSFSIMIFLLICLGTVAITSMNNFRKNAAEIEHVILPAIKNLGDMNSNLMQVSTFTLRFLSEKNDKSRKDTLTQLNNTKIEVSKFSSAFKKTIFSNDVQTLFNNFKTAEDRFYKIQNDIIKLALNNQKEKAIILSDSLHIAEDEMINDIKIIVKANQVESERATNDAEQHYSIAIWEIYIIITLAIGIATIISFFITKSINQPLKEAVTAAETIAQGDLTVDVQVNGNDELSQLSIALSTMRDNLHSAIVHIGNSSSQLASAAEELNSVTDDASKNLESQNNEIKQAASAITQMSIAIDEVSSTAQQTSVSSVESSKLATEGKNRVEDTKMVIMDMNDEITTSTSVINQLAEQVNSIGKFLDVIRAVAEQTNLLALNTAIEAARAGEAGRGFAVVADEVRSLAHRTQESTGEIEIMVREVQTSATEAVISMQNTSLKTSQAQDVAGKASIALEQITSRIIAISDSNHIIASAAEEQSSVSKEIEGNITAISDLAVQTLVGATQTGASAAELTRLAIDLNDMIVKFKV